MARGITDWRSPRMHNDSNSSSWSFHCLTLPIKRSPAAWEKETLHLPSLHDPMAAPGPWPLGLTRTTGPEILQARVGGGEAGSRGYALWTMEFIHENHVTISINSSAPQPAADHSTLHSLLDADMLKVRGWPARSEPQTRSLGSPCVISDMAEVWKRHERGWMYPHNPELSLSAFSELYKSGSFHGAKLSPLFSQQIIIRGLVVVDTKPCLTLCDPVDCSPPGSSVHGNPGKNTGVGCYFLQGIFLTQGSNPCLLHWQAHSLPLSHPGSPWGSIEPQTLCLILIIKIKWWDRHSLSCSQVKLSTEIISTAHTDESFTISQVLF